VSDRKEANKTGDLVPGKRRERTRSERARVFPSGLRQRLRVELKKRGLKNFRTDVLRNGTLEVRHDDELPDDFDVLTSFEDRKVRYRMVLRE
jgi:hypothetical protein